MKDKFQEISNRVKGTFYFSEKTIPIGAGVRDYQEIYSLDFKYDDELIQLENYLGNKTYGTIESNLSFIDNITQVSHLVNSVFSSEINLKK